MVVPLTDTRPVSRSPTAFPAPVLPPSSVNCAVPVASEGLLTCLSPQFTLRPGSSWSAHRWTSGHDERSTVTTAPETVLLAMSRTTTWNWPIAVAGMPSLEPTSEMQEGTVLLGPMGAEASATAGMTAPIRSNRMEHRIEILRSEPAAARVVDPGMPAGRGGGILLPPVVRAPWESGPHPPPRDRGTAQPATCEVYRGQPDGRPRE
jgi:hypothetical protein